MKNISIRQAFSEDICSLALLLAELGYPCAEHSLSLRFEKFIKIDGYEVAVACIDKEVVGFIAWSKSQLFISDMPRFHIEALIVRDKFRAHGIGKQLVKFLEDKAMASTPSIVDLTSGLIRAKDGSHKFYEKLGYNNEGHREKVYLRKNL
jgi:predicted N-acetyltransferase YhbS